MHFFAFCVYPLFLALVFLTRIILIVVLENKII